MAYDPTVFNVDPYYDDYDDNKKFLRVLYKPGYAVQARELTQSQTILQKQVQRFGDHVFKEGSIVSESQVFVNDVKFLRVDSFTGYGGVSVSDFDGLTATVSGKNTVRIINTLNGLSGSNKDTFSLLFFSEYLAGATGFSAGDLITAVYNGTAISCTITGGVTANDYSGAPDVLPYAGNATVVGIDAGIRYIKGYFVNHDRQKVAPYTITGGSSATSYRIFNNLNSVVKFDVTNTIVTSNDDISLNDPAYGSYNYAAPGADRYRLDLTLTHVPFSPTADYALATFENGELSFKSNDPEYNILAKTLARRTYDESGNYTLDDFPISIEDISGDANEGILNIKIGKGKAYVFGNEFLHAGVKSVTADKARSTKSFASGERVDVPFVLGNSSTVSINSSLTSSIFHTINWNGSPLFYMSSGVSGAFSRVGTVRVGKYDPIFDTTKINLYDIRLDSGFTAGAAKRLFHASYTGNDQHIFNFAGGALNVSNTEFNSLLFPLSNDVSSYAVRQIQDHIIRIQRSATFNISAGLTNTISVSDFDANGEFASGGYAQFNTANDFKILSPTGNVIAYSNQSLGNSDSEFNFNPASSVTNATIFASIEIDPPSPNVPFARTKTVTTETASVSMTQNSYEKFAYLNGKVDVFEIVSITGNTGGSDFNMTTYFNLDDGQRDDIYDWSRVVLKSQYYSAGVTGVSVTYKRYARSTSSAPYLIYSYGNPSSLGLGVGGTGANYKQIPVYTFKNAIGQTIPLAGCLDARPDRIEPVSFGATSDPQNYGATGGCQLLGSNFEMAWEYYQPRTDKIVLTPDREFKIIRGVENDDQSPPPSDNDNAMTLATITFNPYTKNASDISTFITKNRRYTMRDIGTLEKRIDRLEYYTTLSLQEQEAKNLEIQDPNGLNKFKNGIFVDGFLTRTNSDYLSRDHSCAIDPMRQEIRPKFLTKYVDFSLIGSIPAGLTYSANGLALCDYTTEIFAQQLLASKGVNVNPFDVTNFNGSLTLTPETDDWIDTQTNPDVIVNVGGQNDGIGDLEDVDFGTVWNNWETTWTGSPVPTTPWMWNGTATTSRAAHIIGLNLSSSSNFRNQNTLPSVSTRTLRRDERQTRSGTRLVVTPETVNRNVGNRIVDLSIIPYMRASTITIKGDGMRPNVRVYPFFDGVNITQYVSVNGVVGDAIVTDSAGRVGYNVPIVFNLPAGTFKTGERLLRLIDDPNNIVSNCTTSAEKIFRAQGLIRTEESTIISSRNLNIRREAVNDERIFSTYGTETRRGGGVAPLGGFPLPSRTTVCWTDPVAQTFLIDPIQYPSGIYMKKVDIFFKTKAANLPITLQLRPTSNGYPSSFAVIPFSEVNLLPASVNVSTDGTTPTAFTFENPVYLQPGEYSIVLISNSNEYEVWVSEVGQIDIASGETIASQPYAGSFFKSQNSSTWTAEQALDLKFVLHKCVFDTSGGALTFEYDESDYSTGYSNITNGANLFRLNTTYISPPSTTVENTVMFEIDSVQVPANSNENIVFSTKKSIQNGAQNKITATITLNTTNDDVTPALDLQRVSGLYVQNLLNDFIGAMSTQQTYEEQPSTRYLTPGTVSATRYLSRRINLQDGFESNDVDVYLSARLPAGSDLKVYMRSQAKTDSSNFESLPYELLQIHPSFANYYGNSQYLSMTEDDYIDLRFVRGGTASVRTSGITGESEFRSFQIKVVMYGDATNTIVPAFRDFKVIAT